MTLTFAELKGSVKDRLRRYGVYESVGPENIISIIDQAVREYRGEIAESPEAASERGAQDGGPPEPSDRRA